MKNVKWRVALFVGLLAFSGNALAAREAYLYASGLESGGQYNSYHILIDGDATNNTGIVKTQVGSAGAEIWNGAQAGCGKCVFSLGSTDAVRADGINNAMSNFSFANPWAATSSVGPFGAMARTQGGFYDGKSTLIRHNGTTWTTTTVVSSSLQRGCAIGNTGGLYVTATETRRNMIGIGDAVASATAASTVAATERGALYDLGSTMVYIDEDGTTTNITSDPLGSVSAVVGGGALVNVGGVAKVWSDSAQTFTVIDFGSGTDEMTVAIALGDDALLQTAGNGMFYYNSSMGSVVSVSGILLGGIAAGDFALVSLQGAGAWFYKDTGAGTYLNWQHGSGDVLRFGGVGGYAGGIHESAESGLFLIGTKP